MRIFTDEDFIREKVPMTKYEIRLLVACEFGLEKKKILEIGTGTGSISCQLAEMGHLVTGIESKEEALRLTVKNFEKLGLKARLVEGMAPEVIPEDDYDAVFIGGSRGQLDSIMKYIDENKSIKRVVATFIRIDNYFECKNLLNLMGFDLDTRQVSITREDKLGMLRAENPIFILRGDRK